ncbi:MAG: hypothetical protein LAT64_07185 [Phycisphaerales bacterium]|nr:hypothetical protein [Planctomycetota bacterium]MCH8508539.1 hypothetical protein [Phycisphaerales bacterium]
MGMIRRADLEQCTRNALVMNLGDLGARGEAMIASAKSEAEKIVREARQERERLIAGAREEGRKAGFEQGRTEGIEVGREEGLRTARAEHAEALAAAARAWTGALESFERDRDAMLQAARVEIVQLAAEVASCVTRRAVELDASVVLAQMEAILGVIARPTSLVLRVHPDDLALANAELPAIVTRFEQCRHAELRPDPSLTRGSCVAATEEGGRVDAEIGAQIDRIVSALLPAGASIRIGREARGDAA